MQKNQYFVYILASKRNGTLYIGVTNNLYRRVAEHKLKIKKGFTADYTVNKLVYFEETSGVYDALNRERQLKKWRREWKLKLIEEENSEWNDLAEDWPVSDWIPHHVRDDMR